MEEKLNLILNEIKEFKKETREEFKKVNSRLDKVDVKLDSLETGLNQVKKVSDITLEMIIRIDKKLDRHEAMIKTQAARNREFEIRLELLEEGLLPESTG